MILGTGTVAGAALIGVADRYAPAFRSWLAADLAHRSRIVLAVCSVMTAGPALAAAGYCWRVGGRHAVVMKAVAIAVAAASVLLVLFLWRLLVLLEAKP